VSEFYLKPGGTPSDDPRYDTPIYDALRIVEATGDESLYALVLDLASIIDFRRDPLAAPVPGRALVELPPPEPALEEPLAPAVRIRGRSIPVQAILDQAAASSSVAARTTVRTDAGRNLLTRIPAQAVPAQAVPAQAVPAQADPPTSRHRLIPTQSRRNPTSAALHAVIALPTQAGPPDGDPNFPDSVLGTPAMSRIRPWEPTP
jgi:hypothetical protein